MMVLGYLLGFFLALSLFTFVFYGDRQSAPKYPLICAAIILWPIALVCTLIFVVIERGRNAWN